MDFSYLQQGNKAYGRGQAMPVLKEEPGKMAPNLQKARRQRAHTQINPAQDQPARNAHKGKGAGS